MERYNELNHLKEGKGSERIGTTNLHLIVRLLLVFPPQMSGAVSADLSSPLPVNNDLASAKKADVEDSAVTERVEEETHRTGPKRASKMATEYYQISSQQGLLPLDSADPDPWLAAATNSLSLNDWGVKSKLHAPPSLFEPDEAEALAWKHVVPMQASPKPEIKAPKVSKQFNSATSSKIDAWSVVDTAVLAGNVSPKQQKKQSKGSSPPSVAEDPKATIEDELAHQNRYKTELCKSFTETGSCRYGTKCQFAHGKEEVRPILRHPKYKTEICKTFHTTGTCPYGIRCRFIHTKSKEESIFPMSKGIEEEEEDDDVNAPPGIPVAKWSKSWNVSMSPALSSKNVHIHDLAEPETAF